MAQPKSESIVEAIQYVALQTGGHASLERVNGILTGEGPPGEQKEAVPPAGRTDKDKSGEAVTVSRPRSGRASARKKSTSKKSTARKSSRRKTTTTRSRA
jgi:hypothetical protein